MKFAVVLSLVSVALANVAVEKRACAGNNCNRAITGTRPGLTPASVRSADCQSFLMTTVTPDAVTVTATVDDGGSPGKRGLEHRATTVSPNAVPTYATAACSNAAEYASACSCYGLTGSVTTAAAPTTTVTTTVDTCDDL